MGKRTSPYTLSGDVFGYINLCIMKCLIGRNVTILRKNCLLDLLRLEVVFAVSPAAAEEDDSSVDEGCDDIEDDVENNIEVEVDDDEEEEHCCCCCCCCCSVATNGDDDLLLLSDCSSSCCRRAGHVDEKILNA